MGVSDIESYQIMKKLPAVAPFAWRAFASPCPHFPWPRGEYYVEHSESGAGESLAGGTLARSVGGHPLGMEGDRHLRNAKGVASYFVVLRGVGEP